MSGCREDRTQGGGFVHEDSDWPERLHESRMDPGRTRGIAPRPSVTSNTTNRQLSRVEVPLEPGFGTTSRVSPAARTTWRRLSCPH